MANYTFFTNPMSRGQIARWALHEAGADYADSIVDLGNVPRQLLDINPMGKVPTIIHHATSGDRVVSEASAICAYLAQMHPEAGLLPTEDQTADYFRWFFFAAGPVEQAVVAKAMAFEPTDPSQQAMAGWGTFERTMKTLELWLAERSYVCGDSFTMADVYVGSQIDWGLTFGTIDPREAFVAYVDRLAERSAYKAAKAIDNGLIEKNT